ncbi:MAG TPA: EAL domain-containing protein [Thermoanaerobaculia bacterium]|nr:EAL domain-containing protein [Thermoanaerobaculia bacterium]
MSVERTPRVPSPDALWELLLEPAADGVVAVADDGRIVFANRAARSWLAAGEELAGREIEALAPEPLRDAALDAFRRYGRGETGDTEGRMNAPPVAVSRDWRELDVAISFGELTLGEQRRFAIVLRDLAQRDEDVDGRADRLRILVEQMPAVLWSTDTDLRFTSSQGAGLAGLGLREDEAIGLSLEEYFQSSDPELPAVASHRRALQGIAADYDFEWSGRVFHCHIEPLRDSGGDIVGVIGVGRDITERKQAEDETRRALSLLSATIESTADGLLVVDLKGRIQSFNRKFAHMWRIPEHVLDTGDDEAALAFVADQLIDPDGFLATVTELYGERQEDEIRDVLEFQDGRVFERYSQPQRIDDRVVGRVWSFRDVTARRRAEQRITHQAYHDALTALPNRLLVVERLEAALESARRSGVSVAVLFLDLDNFKLVNDTLGHRVGDELLQAVADRLSTCVRETDTIGRLGGDEFTIVLGRVQDESDAARVASKVLELISEPFVLTNTRIDVTTSIGVSLFPSNGADVETLLRCADTAMYRAKELGRGNYQLVTEEMTRQASEKLSLVTRLRRAIDGEELLLHYQPIVHLESGEAIAAEALIRWRASDGRILTPEEFIQAAEDTHLVHQLGEYALRSARSQAGLWQEQHPGLRVSVNISWRHAHDPTLAEKVERLLAENGLESSRLELEITDQSGIDGVERLPRSLESLRQAGVRLSIDDFGSGQTSIRALRGLPVHALKIDRSFVSGLTGNPADAAVVAALVEIAAGLGLDTIAEGVETEEQLEALRALGCTAAQGYLFCRPVPPDELLDWLRRR